jgi:heme/copper-type cytochrome/quinol oxidase subunit 2
MALPLVTLTIIMSRVLTESSNVQAAPAETRVVLNVESWDVIGSFLTYKVSGKITLIPNTRVLSVEVT